MKTLFILGVATVGMSTESLIGIVVCCLVVVVSLVFDQDNKPSSNDLQ